MGPTASGIMLPNGVLCNKIITLAKKELLFKTIMFSTQAP